MRTSRIFAAALAATLIGTVLASPLNAAGNFAPRDFTACSRENKPLRVISLIGSKGAFAVALISPDRCGE
jgi:hypothetical protein